MKLKKAALMILPLLMLTGCGESTTSSTAENSSVTESVEAKTYAITAENGTGYEITDLSATTAKRGDKITFKVNVTNSEKTISKVKYNTSELTADENGVYSFTMPARAVTISVELRDKPKTYTITANNGDGYEIKDLSATSAIAGTAITFKVNLTDANKAIKAVKANSITCAKSGDLYTFDMPAEAVTITVELNTAHAITASDGEGYTISELSDTNTYQGKTVTFKVTVTDSLKEIASVKANTVDCTALGAGTYSFVMPNEAVTLNITLKAAALGLDLSAAKTGYIINELVPSQSDTFTSEGIKLFTSDNQGSPVELTAEQYATVTYTSPDIEDLTAPIATTGVKTIEVHFGENTRSFQIAVGTYTVEDVTLVQADLSVKVSVTCKYVGLSEAQFKAFAWGMDLQHNNNVDGQGWGTVIDTDNDGTDLAFTFGENNTVGFALDITALENGAYTTHFGHKLVDNGNGGFQKMDLLKPGGQAKRLVVGDKAYMVQFGAFWNKGDCDITVMGATDPYDKVERKITSTTLAKDENKAMLTITGSYASFFNEELTAEDLSFYLDFEQYNTWTTKKFDEANNVNELDATYNLDTTNKTYSISFDVASIVKEGGEDNGWFMHINNSSANFEYRNLQATSITMDDGSVITMDLGSNLGAPSWANGLVTLKYTAPVVPDDDNVKVTSLSYVNNNGAMELKVEGDYKYTTGAPTIHVGDLTKAATVTGTTFSCNLDVSSIVAGSETALSLTYTAESEEKTLNVKMEDLADKPALGSTTDAVYGFRTNSKGVISLKKNGNDKFSIGTVELKNNADKMELTIYGGLRQGIELTAPTFSLKGTEFSKTLTSPVDANGYVKFTVDVTDAPEFTDPGSGNDTYMFLFSSGSENFEFWPGDWAYQIDIASAATSTHNYKVGRVSQSWGAAQYRLEKTAI